MTNAQTQNTQPPADPPEPLEILHATRVIARVVLELTAPMSIGTGEPGDDADNALVLDANGLPTIPGTSLAGLLRSAWAPTEKKGDDDKGAAFGYQDIAKDKKSAPEAQRSLVRVSWAAIHSQYDRPVEGLRLPDDLAADPVLRAALVPVVRDHVRLNHRGTVHTDGKFTRASVMAGHRFSVELEVSGDGAEARMAQLIALLQSPRTRLGGRTRAGLGAFELVRGQTQIFDLATPQGLKRWIERPLRLSEPLGQPSPISLKPTAEDVLTLKLIPTEPWQIGAGDGDGVDAVAVQNRPSGAHAEKYAPDILPYTERRIEWDDDERQGFVGKPQLVLPASAIKGALRHRTAFHLRREAGEFASTGSSVISWAPEDLPGIKALFGEVNAQDEDRGQVGLLFIDDVRVAVSGLLSTTHVSIDRFTGAPLGGHLFTDISVDDRAPLTIRMRLEARADRPAFAKARVALNRAIDDLCNDRLQLGAGAGRGYGYFEGEAVTTPDWFKGGKS